MKTKTNILLEIVKLQDKPFYSLISKIRLFFLRKELKEIIRKESPEYIQELLKSMKKTN